MSATPVTDELCYDAVTPDSGVHENFNTLTPEEQEKQREEWKSDLAKTEEEIQMLRQVLASKVKQSQDLKRRLGITVWREFTEDFNASVKSVRESQTYQKVASTLTGAGESISHQPLYQKTAGALSVAGEKTSSLFGGIGAKIGQLKESPTFKSFEERVGSAYSSARTSRVGSVSSSTQSFDEAVKEAEGEKVAKEDTPAAPVTPVTSTTTPSLNPGPGVNA